MGGGVRVHDCWWLSVYVSHHVPIQKITMLLPFRLLGGWGGLGLTTVDGSGC